MVCLIKWLPFQKQEMGLEMKELKGELALAQSAVYKAQKLDHSAYQSEDRRGKSLDGWMSDANVQQLRTQVRLDLKKNFVQTFAIDSCIKAVLQTAGKTITSNKL